MYHVWRKEMGVGFNDMLDTPQWVIEEDLDIIAMEHKYGKPPEKKEQKNAAVR